MKAIYKPFGIIFGILSGLVAKRIANFIWSKVDDEDPPKATTEYVSLGKVFAAAVIQGVTMKVVRVAVDRAGARGWSRLTGVWPGEKTPERKDS